MNRLRGSVGSGASGFSPLGALLDIELRRNIAVVNGLPQTIAGTTTSQNYPSVGTFSRASVADWLNSADTGLETQAASGALRREAVRGALIEEAVTAQPVNSSLVGAVAGSPGTAPTGWTLTNPADGLTREIVGTGTSNGIPYIDVRWSGTSSTAGNTTLAALIGNSTIAAVNGQTWTAAAFYALVGGSLTNVSALINRLRFNDSTSSAISGQITDTSILTVTGTLARFSSTGTASSASVAFVATGLVANFTDNSAVDFTIRIGLPTLHQGQLTSPIQTTNSGTVTRAADVLSVPVSSIAAGGDWTVVAVARMPTTPDNSTENLFGLAVDASNRIVMRRSGGNVLTAFSLVGGVNQGGPSLSHPTLGTRFAMALRRSTTNLSMSINGGSLGTFAPTSFPASAFTALTVGSNFVLTGQWNDYIERVIVFPTAVSDATLQSYSTLATWGG